ncbi:MAG: hypothetical protein ACK4UW_00505 [Rhizobium rhizophilum]|uniref:hypothetical protein n=1 Tax=Rhizobium rhizophilum TaxID=1850373 RepID=UPI00391DFE45
MTLLEEFDAAMFDIYRRAKEEAGYNASLFLQMLTVKSGLATAKQLINAGKPSDGYTRLYEKGHLELTVEALVTENPKWHGLFTSEELARARKRLIEYGYAVKMPNQQS